MTGLIIDVWARITATKTTTDDNELTYFHGGRFKQFSQFDGELIKELVL